MEITSQTARRLLGEAAEAYRTSVPVELAGVDDKISVTSGAAWVSWDLTFEGRSWGIKDMDVVLQEISVQASTAHSETGEEADFVAQWSPAKPNGWTAQANWSPVTFPASIGPKSVLVNAAGRLITVKF